jgi:hypothetical protein
MTFYQWMTYRLYEAGIGVGFAVLMGAVMFLVFRFGGPLTRRLRRKPGRGKS